MKKLCKLFVSYPHVLSLLCLAVLSACAPSRTQETTARVQIMVEEHALQALDLGTYISNDYCYALHATTPNDPRSNIMVERNLNEEPELSRAECPYQPIGPGVLSTTLAPPGGELAMEIAIGPGRRFDLIAIPKAAVGGDCNQSLSFGPDLAEPDHVGFFIGGKTFNDDSKMRIMAHSPLTTIVGGSNDVPLSEVVATSTFGEAYLCEHNGGSGQAMQVMLPGESNNGVISTGMPQQFFVVACPLNATSMGLAMPDLDSVYDRNGQLITLSNGQYTVSCDSKPEAGNKLFATFGLVKHTSTFGPGSNKPLTFVAMGDGVVIETRGYTLQFSDQFQPLLSASGNGSEISFSGDSGASKFAATMRGGALGYQRLLIQVPNSGMLGAKVVELGRINGSPILGYDNVSHSSQIPAVAPSLGQSSFGRFGTNLMQFWDNTTNYILKTANFLSSSSTFAFSIVTPATPITLPTKPDVAVSDGKNLLFATLTPTPSPQTCNHAFLQMPFQVVKPSYDCNSGTPPLYTALRTLVSGFEAIRPIGNGARFNHWDNSAWVQTDSSDGNGSVGAVDFVRGLDRTVALRYSSTPSPAIYGAAFRLDHSTEFNSGQVNFSPAWSGGGTTLKFVKALNLGDIGNTDDLFLDGFFGQEILAGGSINDGGFNHSVLYRSPNGGKNWYRVYKGVANSAVLSATPVVLDYGFIDGKPYLRAGFAVVEETSPGTFRILLQNYKGF